MQYAFAVAALISLACAEPSQMTITTLAQGPGSQIEEPRTAVARTAAEWSKLWSEHGGMGKRPEVDFARSTVIAVFAGTRPTAGHSVEITRIEKDGDELVVTYRERAPAAGDMVAQMLTSPFHIVSTEAYQGPVRFTRTR
jgi:hypothetical protein